MPCRTSIVRANELAPYSLNVCAKFTLTSPSEVGIVIAFAAARLKYEIGWTTSGWMWRVTTYDKVVHTERETLAHIIQTLQLTLGRAVGSPFYAFRGMFVVLFNNSISSCYVYFCHFYLLRFLCVVWLE